MNKQDIEDAVRKVLDKQEPPLATAVKYEVANYERSISEIKELHRRNLTQLLGVFRLRGAADSRTAIIIQERLNKL